MPRQVNKNETSYVPYRALPISPDEEPNLYDERADFLSEMYPPAEPSLQSRILQPSGSVADYKRDFPTKPMTVAPSGPMPKLPGESAEEAYARLFAMMEAKRQRYMEAQKQREQQEWLAGQQGGGESPAIAPQYDDTDPNGSSF